MMAFLEYEPKSALFHYTNQAGLEGILTSKTIWFADLSTTNDPREIALGRDLVIDAMKLVRHEMFPGSQGFPISMLAGKIVSYLKRNGLFSCSMSHSGDSLPMWREYADYGAGFSIGFRARALTDMPVRISKIHYVDEASPEHFASVVQEILTPYLRSWNGPNDYEMAIASGELAAKMAGTKHGSWSYENEIRLTHAAPPDNQRHEINGDEIPSYEYPDGQSYFSEVFTLSALSGSERAYVPIAFGKYNNGAHNPTNAIQSITLGPKCEADEGKIRALLLDAGYAGFEINRSDCQIN